MTLLIVISANITVSVNCFGKKPEQIGKIFYRRFNKIIRKTTKEILQKFSN